MRVINLHDHFWFGTFRNRLAYLKVGCKDKRSTLYVFTGISAKRANLPNRIPNYVDYYHKRPQVYDNHQHCRIVFLSNKNIMDLNHPLADWYFMKEVRNLVTDGKIGTRYSYSYKNTSSYGGKYFDGLTSTTTKLKPVIKPILTFIH